MNKRGLGDLLFVPRMRHPAPGRAPGGHLGYAIALRCEYYQGSAHE